MPEPLKAPENQTGHRTKAERAARMAATEGMKRKTVVRLRAPGWMSEEALAIWKRTLRQARGLDLLDLLDENMLAIYCDAVARYRQASSTLIVLDKEGEPTARDESIKAAQAWARVVAQYADKLGLSPAARARLAKRKADEITDSFGEAFDD